jgi:tetratricopeptide (TPR) repeat protein
MSETSLFQKGSLIGKFIILLLVAIFIISCKNSRIRQQMNDLSGNRLSPSGIVIDYPRDSTIFPPELPSPEFIWKDTINKTGAWNLFLSAADGKVILRVTVNSQNWRPDSLEWINLKRLSSSGPVSLTIIGSKKGLSGGKLTSAKIHFSTSSDSIGASVFYRAVPLPFGYAAKHVNEIEWYTGNVAGGKPHKILDKIPVCANCHSFSANGVIAMDIDYSNDKGSYFISSLDDTVMLSNDKIITWSDYKRFEGEPTYGLLSQISPDGRYVLSTVKDRSVFVAVDDPYYSQLFFPIKGILCTYDRTTRKFFELPGACDKKYVQSNPNWSPDGKEVLFTKATRYMSSKIEKSASVLLNAEDVKEFISRQKEFKFDLYRLPFNEGRGGIAAPVPGASANNKSNYFARYSPDGKWIVFCQAENFMLLQHDSKLYIMPAAGGNPRPMKCNTEQMNSWHSWSPNSRWLLFSSKARGPYTQLYVTHIDENGNDSPPVFLENLVIDKRAANIPEFLNNSFPHLSKMIDDFSQNAMYYNRRAAININDKEYKDALENIANAISKDSSYFDAYNNRLTVNLILGRSGTKADLLDRAIAARLIGKEIQQNPADISLLLKRGELLLIQDDYDGALADGITVLKMNPMNFSAYELVAAAYQKLGQWDKAASYLKDMLKIQPENMKVNYSLANLYQGNKQLDLALDILNKLINRYPNESAFYISRANLLMSKGDKAAAKDDFEKAVTVDPENYDAFRERGSYYLSISSSSLAKKDYEKAILLLENVIKANPQNAPLLVSKAEIMEQDGNIQGALNEYDNYLRNWPLNYSVLNKEGKLFIALKQYPRAIEAYSLIIENFPEDSKAFSSRGLAFQQSGNHAQAINDFDKAISLNPEEYASLFFRARSKYSTGDVIGYRNDLRSAESVLNRQMSVRKLAPAEQGLLENIRKMLSEKSR